MRCSAIVFLLFPAALGASVRYRTTSRLRELDQVKLREREQLARELHDTVAHHVSAIAIRAQAGRVVAASHPDAAVDALEVIEEEASRTLAEMRSMVGALREDEEPELAPQRGVADIERLARPAPVTGRVSRCTCRATSTTSGRRSGRRSTASPRSRSPTRCGTPATPPASTCRVAGDDDCVRLTVRDDGDAGSTGRQLGRATGSWA